MVFIHGGAFNIGAGSAPMYDGSNLTAKKNVIVVTINYRLGVLGFLTGPNLCGNYGIKDQQLALQWVRQNIASFGGDSDNVTIFGESAGPCRWAYIYPPHYGINRVSHTITPELYGQLLNTVMFPGKAGKITGLYPSSSINEFNGAMISRIMTDYLFYCPNRKLAGANNYSYEFTHHPVNVEITGTMTGKPVCPTQNVLPPARKDAKSVMEMNCHLSLATPCMPMLRWTLRRKAKTFRI